MALGLLLGLGGVPFLVATLYLLVLALAFGLRDRRGSASERDAASRLIVLGAGAVLRASSRDRRGDGDDRCLHRASARLPATPLA